MPVLFCNIPWMRHYAGRDSADPPLGGGGFVVKNGIAGEECNFVPCEDGFIYGHCETIKDKIDRQINIQRLGASKSAVSIDGIDVVWTAPKNGKNPRVVVGWSRAATVYRRRQSFNGQYPSAQHDEDKIRSFIVRAKAENVVLLPWNKRTLELDHGEPGWSGQTNWWYAEESTNKEAKAFVKKVRSFIAAYEDLGFQPPLASSSPPKKGPAGKASSEAYIKYAAAYEAVVHPKHDKLQKRFESFLKEHFKNVKFPKPFRDDLRYVLPSGDEVMVEIKPTDATSLRYAVRTAIGQLLDYRQHQKWTGRQLIVVQTEVTNVDDLRLAHDNGFGLAWPIDSGFKLVWPA